MDQIMDNKLEIGSMWSTSTNDDNDVFNNIIFAVKEHQENNYPFQQLHKVARREKNRLTLLCHTNTSKGVKDANTGRMCSFHVHAVHRSELNQTELKKVNLVHSCGTAVEGGVAFEPRKRGRTSKNKEAAYSGDTNSLFDPNSNLQLPLHISEIHPLIFDDDDDDNDDQREVTASSIITDGGFMEVGTVLERVSQLFPGISIMDSLTNFSDEIISTLRHLHSHFTVSVFDQWQYVSQYVANECFGRIVPHIMAPHSVSLNSSTTSISPSALIRPREDVYKTIDDLTAGNHFLATTVFPALWMSAEVTKSGNMQTQLFIEEITEDESGDIKFARIMFGNRRRGSKGAFQYVFMGYNRDGGFDIAHKQPSGTNILLSERNLSAMLKVAKLLKGVGSLCYYENTARDEINVAECLSEFIHGWYPRHHAMEQQS